MRRLYGSFFTARRRVDGVAMGVAVRRHFAVDRGRAAALSKVWRAHYGKIVLAWAALTIAPLAVFQGGAVALATVLQVILSDYVS